MLTEYFPQIRFKAFWQPSITLLTRKVGQVSLNSNCIRIKSSVRQKGGKAREMASRLSENLSLILLCFRAQKTPMLARQTAGSCRRARVTMVLRLTMIFVQDKRLNTM